MPVYRLICLAFRTDVGCFGCHDPQVGHGPALVIRPALYNGKTGRMVCCPMKTEIKAHPFEVVAEVAGVPCAVLSDQVKLRDWKIRRAKKKAIVSAEVMLHVRAKMKALLQITSSRSRRRDARAEAHVSSFSRSSRRSA
ncbi:MAG: type II toxin-antitoxin system PemK/MazF family toxin [Burkholderiales bacterium]